MPNNGFLMRLETGLREQDRKAQTMLYVVATFLLKFPSGVVLVIGSDGGSWWCVLYCISQEWYQTYEFLEILHKANKPTKEIVLKNKDDKQ